MNENLNLVEKLKNVPEGTTFYNTVIGYCDYKGYDQTRGIFSFRNHDGSVEVRKNGKLCEKGECIIFPSKDQRDWDKFEYDPIEIGTPVMVHSTLTGSWLLRYYARDGYCYDKQKMEGEAVHWDLVITVTEFDFENLCRKGEKL